MWKIFFIAVFAVGALADDMADFQKQILEPFLKKECMEGSPNTVDGIVKSLGAYVKAVTDLINPNALKEFEEARKSGTVDKVAKKYCDMASAMKNMIDDLKSKIRPCLEHNFSDFFELPTDVKLIDYLCYEDGKKIAHFITEGGIDCLHSKGNELSVCAESLKISNLNYILENNKPEILTEKLTQSIKEQCANMEHFSSCAVDKMKGCPSPNLAHMAETLSKFILNDASLCKKIK